MTNKRSTLAMSLCLVVLSLSPVLASELIFDNYCGSIYYWANKGAGASSIAAMVFDQDTTINRCEVLADLGAGGNLKFVIFEMSAMESGTRLFVSSPKAFMDDGWTWKASDAMPFTFRAGKSYAVGAIADVPALWHYDATFNSMNGVRSAWNVNIGNFADPAIWSSGVADMSIRLYVPEAGSMTILATLLAALAPAMHRRRRGQASP